MTGLKGYVVEYHKNVLNGYLVKAHSLCYSFTAVVHICFGFHDKHTLPAYLSLTDKCLELMLFYFKAVLLFKRSYSHKARIVS